MTGVEALLVAVVGGCAGGVLVAHAMLRGFEGWLDDALEAATELRVKRIQDEEARRG